MRIGFMRQFKEYMDLMAEKSEYATAEWEFKRGDMLTQALKKTHFQREMKELNDSYEHFKSVYQKMVISMHFWKCQTEFLIFRG